MLCRVLPVLAVLLPSIASAEATFTRDVAPILYRHCAGCHHAGDIAPMPLITYSDTKPWAAAIKEAVLTRKMPPWKADPRYGHWSNNSSLTDPEIAVLKNWAENGKPEGDPKLLPSAPTFAEGWKIGKPDTVISIPAQKLEGSGPDQYVYITVPSGFS